MELAIFLCSCVLLFPLSRGQHPWTQRDCQAMAAACSPLPRGSPGTIGTPGIKGLPGTRGKLGIPGRPGIPGSQLSRSSGVAGPEARGDTGHPGVPGPIGDPGQAGPSGVPGNTGYQGFPGGKGNKGEEGQVGLDGERGLQGDAGEWSKCTWNVKYTKDSGLIKECIITKRAPTSMLHVVYEGSLQVGLCQRCCKIWYFTFHGLECTSPTGIEAVMSGGLRSDYPYYTYGRIEGICENQFPEGTVRVALHIKNCQYFSDSIDSVNISLYDSIGRILIREVVPPQ